MIPILLFAIGCIAISYGLGLLLGEWSVRRQIRKLHRRLPPSIFVPLFMGLMLCQGCAHFASRTIEESVDANGKPVTRSTHMYVTTFFDSGTQLAKARNSPAVTSSNQWSAGTVIGGLNQQASGTNAVEMLQVISQILGQVAVAAAKP